MIIDKAQLISLLEEKTGLDRERVEDQLSELIKRILRAAEEGKSFEIEGFGTFSMKEDKLRFEPSDMLETEINNKYAGMKPIELMGAFKEPEGDEVPAIDIDEEIGDTKDKVWAFDKDSAEEQEASEEPVAESGKEPADEQEEENKEPVEEIEGQQEPVTAEKSAEEIFDLPESSEDDFAPPEFPAEKEAESDDEPSEVVPTEGTQEEKDIMSQLLVAAVVIIAIGLSGWVAYDTGLIGTEENSTENIRQAGQGTAQQSENIQEASSPGAPPKNSEEDNNSEPEEELAVGTEEDLQPIRETEEESTFGLTGDVKTINGGYTIVVHSLRSMQKAEDRKENLQDSGYRALISKANVQGTTYFRVGLGQFKTVDDALEAVSDIPESFQSHQKHFIKRIQ